MKVVIDRFEENYAVCEKEDRTMINLEKKLLPSGAKEGDILVLQDSTILIDKAASQKRKNEIDNLMKDIWK